MPHVCLCPLLVAPLSPLAAALVRADDPGGSSLPSVEAPPADER